MKTITKSYISGLLKPRIAESHKGNYGHALLIAGNKGKMGAAVIAATACLRSGTGLLTVNVPTAERIILQTSIPEAMLMMREDHKYEWASFSGIGIGPGIGLEKTEKRLLESLLKSGLPPIVFDADALNIFAGNKKLFNKIPKGSIITPHPKEFDRIFGEHSLVEDRIATALKVSREFDIVVVLKGHKTLVTYKGESWINTSGNAGLAKGGSGDALTGMITAFLSQGYEPFVSSKIGVYLHGVAADITLEKQSMESMLITDVIENIGNAFKWLDK